MSDALPTPREAMKILREADCPAPVINHCKAVARFGVRLARKCKENGIDIDLKLVHVGALLHDLGRSKTHNVNHGVVGSEIARKMGLPTPIVLIIERHIGGGITSKEAAEMGWPRKSYMPRTLEEKIVAYADKLIEGSRIVSIEETLQQLRSELGKDHPAVRRVASLHEEISVLCHGKR